MNLKTKYLILLTQLLTVVENKIPNVNNLVKKLAITQKLVKLKKKISTDHDCNKYNITRKFNKLTSENLLQNKNKQIQQAKVNLLILQKRQILMIS